MNPLDFLKERVLDLGAGAFNQLPDRANLFLRYMSGLGDRNLDLDEGTLDAAREASYDFPNEAYILKKGVDESGNKIEYKVLNDENLGPWKMNPRSGPVISYGTLPYEGHVLSNTLGQYYVDSDPDKGVRIIDKYDMENAAEDPDLVSGKFQPRKALNELEAIWNPIAGLRNDPHPISQLRSRESENIPFSLQSLRDGLGYGKYNQTHSPLTRLARAGMYLAPWKPTPFDIDVTVPYEGRIHNSEVYNR
tara:strand:- start:281 stop:1027 length:747 start_codon:yes stop_codon:yes gene_type:complete